MPAKTLAANTARRAVTVCFPREFGMGVHVVDAWLVEHGTRRWAQYEAAPFVDFVPKGARKARRWQGGYKPNLVIVEGHHAAELRTEMFETVSESDSVRVERGRYSAFDSRWQSDFDARLAALGAEIVADYRPGAATPSATSTPTEAA